MSDRPTEDLTNKGVSVLMLHWIDEILKLSELVQVLHRSVSYTRYETELEGRKQRCVGDDLLVQHIRDRLDNLFVEIEEAKDRLRD